jgi:hypothetical protein
VALIQILRQHRHTPRHTAAGQSMSHRLSFSSRRPKSRLKKLPFLYGLRGKAAWRLNRVIACVALIIFLYLKVNDARFSIAIAKEVPLGWKWGGLLAMLGSLAYGYWRMGRHIQNPTLPRSKPAWLLLPVAAAFTFSIVTADQQTLFNWGTILWVLVGSGIGRYFRRKRVRRRQGVSEASA